MRLPAFMAGLASVGAMAWFCLRLGFPGAGALVAWLMALHPWIGRFVPEARGYAFLFLLFPLACLAALNALQTGKWKWWLALAAAQFGMAAAWCGAIESLVLLNLGILAAILIGNYDHEARKTACIRFFLSCCLAGMAALQLYLPCLLQFSSYAENMAGLPVDATWLRNVLSRFFTGFMWTIPFHGEPLPYLSGEAIIRRSPVLSTGLVVIGFFSLLIGATRLLRAGLPGSAFLPVLLLPAPLFIGVAIAKNITLLEWYVVGALPGLLSLAALGLCGIAASLPGRFRQLAGLGPVRFLICFAWVNVPSWQTLLTTPITPLRESVLLKRPSLDPSRGSEILTASNLAPPTVYDPRAAVVQTSGELEALMRQSDATGRPLFINQAYTLITVVDSPRIAELLFSPVLFEHQSLPGIEPIFKRDVFRYLGGGPELPAPSGGF